MRNGSSIEGPAIMGEEGNPANGWYVVRMLGLWAALFGLYLLLAGTMAAAEVVAGLAAATVAGLAAWAVRSRAGWAFAPRLRWIGHMRRLPVAVAADCAIVCAALVRALATGKVARGAFRVLPFDPGGDDPHSTARRALVIACVSVAPNAYVVTVDREKGRMLLHQLVRTADPPGGGDREWPL